jgi:hypothetical protein
MDNGAQGKRFFVLDEDALRQKALKLCPEIRRERERMEDVIRELVRLERSKLGLDNPRGALELWPNEQKKTDDSPDLIGKGVISGKLYRAAAWLTKNGNLKIALLPQKHTT